MKVSENNLIGWLCMIRHAMSNDEACFVPTSVLRQLAERGWLETDPERDWDGKHHAHVTDAGCAVSDLNGPEWGIEPVFVE